MKAILKNKLKLQNIPKSLERKIRACLTFENPKYLENLKHGYSNWKTKKVLKFYEKKASGLILPRGFIEQLKTQCRIDDRIDDQRRILPKIDFTFHGKLRPFQEQAVTGILSRDFGTLSAATGSGKTVIALYMIAERKQPALVVVHTKELLNQWIDRITTFLKIPKNEIGIIGNGKYIIGEKITVALVQSLYKCAEEVSQHIGHLIVDECHRAPSRTFTEAVTAFDSKYMLGLSATPWRRDKLSRLIFWFIGDVVHEVDNEDLINTGDILEAEVVTRETDYQTTYNPSEEYSKMLSELTTDTKRNALIVSDVAREAQNGGGICLVLSDRKGHCKAIQGLLQGVGIDAELLVGDLSNGKREDVVKRLNSGQIKVLIATGQLIGEGFDLPAMQTLFLTTPVRFNGRVIQYVGRVLRPSPGKKKAKVYDYIDSNVGVLKAAAKARASVYERN